MPLNTWGQPVGTPLPGWRTPPRPVRETLSGRHCRLEPLDADQHAAPLFQALAADPDERAWTYLAYGPFADAAAYAAWMRTTCVGDDPLFFAIVEPEADEPIGVAAYLRIAPAAGSIEVGHLLYSHRLRQRPAATEAMYLLMRHAFELGYRRYEWKCDALNAPSRAAAERLGFVHEGLFRQAIVTKGRNRDTAWYSIVDGEWPTVRRAFETWLSPENFDERGEQRRKLAEIRGAQGGRDA